MNSLLASALPWKSHAIQINRMFAHIENRILDVSHINNSPSQVLEDKRNLITRVDTREASFVVKDFRGMYFLNRLAYTWFRKTKSIRSYLNSQLLNEMGIRTPAPIAWFDEYSWGILSRSVYVSAFYPHKTLLQYIAIHREKENFFIDSLLHDLAKFAIRLHRLGVLHDDFSVGNIFVVPTTNGYDFALVDVNRMRFRTHVSFDRGLRNMRKLQLDPPELQVLISAYASLLGQDKTNALQKFFHYQKRRSVLRSIRKKIKRYTIGLMDKVFTS